jgi:hypothetical protein
MGVLVRGKGVLVGGIGVRVLAFLDCVGLGFDFRGVFITTRVGRILFTGFGGDWLSTTLGDLFF